MKASQKEVARYKSIFAAWLGAALLAVTVAAGAQNYPNKTIRIITSQPGGSSNLMARLIAPVMSSGLGQPVIVDNRAGLVAVEVVSKAAPDGYSLLFYGSVVWLQPFLRDDVPWDPIKDFAPISLTTRSPNVLVVSPSVPANSIQQLVAYAKAHPGELKYSSAGAGASTQLAAELFKAMAGVDIVSVPYKGDGPALVGLLGGDVQMMFPPPLAVAGELKAGKLKALGVTTSQPSALLSGVPTIASSGLPGYESAALQGVFAPGGTSAVIVNQLNREIVKSLNQPDIKEKILAVGAEVVASSPEQFAAAIKSDMARSGKIIKDAGIRAQ